MKSENEKDFFISYRTLDEGWAAWIAWQLEAAGYTTFLQAWDFRPGHNFVSQMQVGVTSGVRMLAVLTPSYFESGFARAEWFAAFAQDPTGEKGLLLPVRVEECNVEGLLGQIIYVNLVGLDEEAARQRLLEGLQQKRAKPTIPPRFPGGDRDSLRPKPAFPASNPYRGLEPFRAEHRLAFKGRDRYIEAVLKKLHEKRLVAIVGASGSGKSSLALAGVLPALADAGWLTATCRPRLNPFIELARALMKYLEPNLTEPGPLWEAAERYAKQLRNTPGDVSSLLSLVVECNNKQGLVVLIDQFEELFLSVVHADHAAFIALIEQVWRDSSVPVRWLITLRADFMEVALQGEALTAMLQDADVKLGPMDKEELRAVIIEPASALDVSFAPGLPERLIHDAIGAGSADSKDGAKDGREGRLPLLEFALQQLWERQQDSVIHHAAYDDSATGIGGLQGALRRHAEQVYTRLDDEQRARTRRLFRRLVEQGPDLRDVRRILPRWEVADDWETLVVPLANARLLTTNEPALGQATVEVIHEQLLRAWPELRKWINENREFDYWRQGLTELAAHWQDAPLREQPDLLLRGTQLDKALVYLSERGDDLKEFERSFITAGQTAREETVKQTEKQRHRLIAGLVVFLFFMALLATLAAWQWWRAEGQAELAWKQTELMLARTQDALTGFNKAASLYESSGQFGEAEPLFVQSRTLSKEVFGNRDPRTLTSLNNLALLYHSQGRYREAEPLFIEALQLRREVLGPRHPDTLQSLNNLALLYHSQGRYREAEPLFIEALQLRREVLSPHHPDTLQSLDNLASLYHSQGRYGEAEPLFQQALAAREKVLGLEHRDTLTSVNSLAALYQAQGRYGEAEPLYQRALVAREKVLGPTHPDTLTNVNNLAVLYYAQGRYGEAEPLYQRALVAREKVLGPTHPDTLTNVNNLAVLYYAQGHYEEAEPLYQRALAAREKVLGLEHPDTLSSVNNLAELYQAQGRYGEAEALFRRTLAIREKILGSTHPGTAITINNLAEVLRAQGRLGEAEPLYRQALAIREKVLGPEHPATAESLNHLAGVLKDGGRLGKAEPLYRRALVIREKVLGAEHPATAESLNHLAGVLKDEGRLGEAEPLYRRALAIREKILGPEHPATAESLDNLAGVLKDQGRLGEAEPLFRRALAIREKMLGTEHPATAESLDNLAGVLKDQGRLGEAEPLYRRALAIREKVLGAEHPATAKSLDNLAGVLKDQGRVGEAEPLYRQAVAVSQQAEAAPAKLLVHSRNLGVFLVGRGRFQDALPYYRTAIDTLDRLFAYTQGLPEEARQTFLGQYAHCYHEFIELSLKLHEQDPKAGYDRELLALISRNQSRIFSELLRQADVKTFAADPTFVDLKNRRELLEQRLSLLREKYATVPSSAANADSQRAAFSEQIKQAESELQVLEQGLWKDYPRFMELVQPRPVTVDDLQKRLLHPGEALLSFVLLKDRTVLLAVTRERFTLRTVAVTEKEITERVGKIRGPLEQVTQLDKLDPAVLHALYQDLIAPVEDTLHGTNRVLVVADGPLYNLPLELLVTAYGETEQRAFRRARQNADGSAKHPLLGEYATLPYLADRYRFSYLPSLAVLVSQRTYPKPPVPMTRNLIAFADPIFSREDSPTSGDPFPRLRESAEEAHAIADLLGDDKGLYLGDQAQERTVKALNTQGQFQGLHYLLFSTHGLLGGEFLPPASPSNPPALARLEPAAPARPKQGEPALVLTLVGDLHGEDGFLTMSDVLELNLNTDLVVLSAANTAGDPQRSNQGEGFAGLTRSFLFAGARHLLVSHWPVGSHSTRDLMVTMFTQLQAGQPLLEALAEARRRVRGQTWQQAPTIYISLAHPFFWAPFVVVGD